MLEREIENAVFLRNTEIFEERKHMAFLLLLRPTYRDTVSFETALPWKLAF